MEILIIDDGSKDMTPEIADAYEKKYPGIVRAIHQENGGHGAAVNAGLKCAKHNRVMRYASVLPQGRVFGWEEVKRFRKGQYILMHSVIYRTQLLKDCGLELPRHTFYVDNLFVYQPLPHVKYMYYLDVDFYRYFIGRDDQSVNEKVMIGRIDQQIKVNKIMVDSYTLWKIQNRKLRHYMFNYLEIITVISTVMLIRSGTAENLEKKRELWRYIKQQDIRLFHRLRSGISIAAYKISQKVVGFN